MPNVSNRHRHGDGKFAAESKTESTATFAVADEFPARAWSPHPELVTVVETRNGRGGRTDYDVALQDGGMIVFPTEGEALNNSFMPVDSWEFTRTGETITVTGRMESVDLTRIDPASDNDDDDWDPDFAAIVLNDNDATVAAYLAEIGAGHDDATTWDDTTITVTKDVTDLAQHDGTGMVISAMQATREFNDKADPWGAFWAMNSERDLIRGLRGRLGIKGPLS